MKKMNVIAVSILFISFLLAMTILLSGITVTIKGKGIGETTFYDDGSWEFICDASNMAECSLTVEIKPPVK